jgi:integrase
MAAAQDNEQGKSQREPAMTTALAKRDQPNGEARLLLHSDAKRRSVALGPVKGKRWQPPEGLSPADVQAIIDAAPEGRDRLLLRVLWATGGRISEALALRACDIQRDALVLPNRKNPGQPTKRLFLPTGSLDLPGELLLWQKQQHLEDDDPLFCSRKKGPDGKKRAISRVQAWKIVKAASARAGIQVLALRPSQHGDAGAPAPVHPHLFRHARVRQLVRQTKSLPLAQKQAGWSRLQMAYLTIGDEEARDLMRGVPE